MGLAPERAQAVVFGGTTEADRRLPASRGLGRVDGGAVGSRPGACRFQPVTATCGLRPIKASISPIKSFIANGFVMYPSQPLSRSFSSSIRKAVAITIGIFCV